MNDCIFCKIASREIPADIFYEDEHSIAFLDIKPINPGHTLVMPKNHYKDFLETPEDVLASMSATTKRIGAVLKDVVGADAMNIGINNGAAAGQIIFHTHIHLIPRFENDGLKSWERNASTIFPDKDELLEKIKKNL